MDEATSTEQRAIELFADHFGVEKATVTLDSHLIDDLGSDALDLIELCLDIEDKFEIFLTDEQTEKIKTVGDCVDLIKLELE